MSANPATTHGPNEKKEVFNFIFNRFQCVVRDDFCPNLLNLVIAVSRSWFPPLIFFLNLFWNEVLDCSYCARDRKTSQSFFFKFGKEMSKLSLALRKNIRDNEGNFNYD